MEEVLAIERERDGEYSRSTVIKAGEKRKRKNEDLDEDEEILNLAGGDAKTSSTTATHVTSIPQTVSYKPIHLKPKTPEKDTPFEPAHPVGSSNVKEKNPVLPAKAKKSQPGSAASSSVAPINEKKCRELLKTLLKLPQAAIFSRPVDPVLDGCPTYVPNLNL